MPEVNRQLIVYDFDWSMADQDTDRWIFEVLAPDLRRKMKTLKEEIQWTDLVAQSLREAHARGITKEQIEHALKIMPFHPAMVRAITDLKAAGKTSFVILSNANEVFISTVLEEKGLTDKFEEVITNRAEWDPSGLLKLRRRVDPNGPQHSCTIGCSPNMCKGRLPLFHPSHQKGRRPIFPSVGEELDAFLTRHLPTFDRVVYVGDGSNDFCPILRLRSQDLVLCRSFRGLQRRIANEGERLGLKCQVKYWAGAWEIEEIFKLL